MTVATLPASLTLNLRTLQLGGPQGLVDVSDPECLLLKALAAGTDQRLDTPRMLEHVGKSADAAGKRALDVQLVRLRKKLTQAGAPAPTIKCIRGQGYQLCVSLEIRHFS
jgi:DNA-binding response OmpR family regulator